MSPLGSLRSPLGSLTARSSRLLSPRSRLMPLLGNLMTPRLSLSLSTRISRPLSRYCVLALAGAAKTVEASMRAATRIVDTRFCLNMRLTPRLYDVNFRCRATCHSSCLKPNMERCCVTLSGIGECEQQLVSTAFEDSVSRVLQRALSLASIWWLCVHPIRNRVIKV